MQRVLILQTAFPGSRRHEGTMFKKAVVKTSQNPLGGKETKKLRGDIRKRLDISEAQLDTFFGVLSCPASLLSFC